MATITRWEPMQDMLTLREAMNSLFEESFVPSASRGATVPAMDVSETRDAYTIELVVPGLRAEDLEITMENGILSISGTIRQAQKEEGRHVHRTERRYGSFKRTITLPATVKADQIAATLESGILRVDVPKAEEVKPRKITVHVNAPAAVVSEQA